MIQPLTGIRCRTYENLLYFLLLVSLTVLVLFICFDDLEQMVQKTLSQDDKSSAELALLILLSSPSPKRFSTPTFLVSSAIRALLSDVNYFVRSYCLI